MSDQQPKPKRVRYEEVSTEPSVPAWLSRDARARGARPDPIHPLVPPEVPSHARPALAPRVLESVRPPALPSQPPPRPSRVPSQRPGPLDLDDPEMPEPMPVTPPPRPDTLVEDLVPRAEEEAVEAIGAALESFARERQQALAEAEGELAALVRVICRRVLLAELAHNPLIVERLVRAGLEALGGGDRVSVKLGPFFEGARAALEERLTHQGIACSVLIDPSIGEQGCQLSTDLGRVDESVERRLDVLLDNLDLLEEAAAVSSARPIGH